MGVRDWLAKAELEKHSALAVEETFVVAEPPEGLPVSPLLERTSFGRIYATRRGGLKSEAMLALEANREKQELEECMRQRHLHDGFALVEKTHALTEVSSTQRFPPKLRPRSEAEDVLESNLDDAVTRLNAKRQAAEQGLTLDQKVTELVLPEDLDDSVKRRMTLPMGSFAPPPRFEAEKYESALGATNVCSQVTSTYIPGNFLAALHDR